MFKIITCEAFKRLRGDEPVFEARPCIIGTTGEAREFIEAGHACHAIGSFYVGGAGSCLHETAWLPCLRFINDRNIAVALASVQERFEAYRDRNDIEASVPRASYMMKY